VQSAEVLFHLVRWAKGKFRLSLCLPETHSLSLDEEDSESVVVCVFRREAEHRRSSEESTESTESKKTNTFFWKVAEDSKNLVVQRKNFLPDFFMQRRCRSDCQAKENRAVVFLVFFEFLVLLLQSPLAKRQQKSPWKAHSPHASRSPLFGKIPAISRKEGLWAPLCVQIELFLRKADR
jgi:hypothetical protein